MGACVLLFVSGHFCMKCVFLRPTHVAVCSHSWFILLAVTCSLPHFLHFTFDGHLSSFHFLAMDSAVNTPLQVFFGECLHISVGRALTVELLGGRVCVCLACLFILCCYLSILFVQTHCEHTL